MQKKNLFITIREGLQVLQGDKIITLPANKVFTYVETDKYEQVWVNVDGLDCRLFLPRTPRDYYRELPYPIEKPSSISGYRHLLTKIIRDMEDALEVSGISVEVNSHDARIHIV